MPTIELVRIYRSVAQKPRARGGVQNLREWLLVSIETELQRRAQSAAKQFNVSLGCAAGADRLERQILL